MGKIRFVMMPSLKGSNVGRESGMWDTIFLVGSGAEGKRPKVVMEVGIK
jgi:hypothetical protein